MSRRYPAGFPSTSAVPRVVVLSAAGGEGATTVTTVIAALRAEQGRRTTVISRADDPIAGQSGSAGSRPQEVLADAGPHGGDDTARPGDVAVLVCAATTGSIERAKLLLDDVDARGRAVAALVICARSAREHRRGLVRMMQVSRADARIVLFGYDPAIAAAGWVDAERLAPATRDAGAHLLSLLDR